MSFGELYSCQSALRGRRGTKFSGSVGHPLTHSPTGCVTHRVLAEKRAPAARGFACVVGLVVLAACGSAPAAGVDAGDDAGVVDAGLDAGDVDSGITDSGAIDAGPPKPDDAFADVVIRFMPGPGAGFGQASLPDVVLGAPRGGGDGQGSLDVLALGQGGVIELGFTDVEAIDGPGIDLLVFENPFANWLETGIVSVSNDGVTWHDFPCAAEDKDGGYPGCAGVKPVFADDDGGVRVDPSSAGGDGFDLATLGLSSARFVRITDTGRNPAAPPGGGFDLDALAVVNGRRVDGGPW